MKNYCLTCKKKISEKRKFCSHKCYWENLVGSKGYWLNKKRPNLIKTNAAKTMFKKGNIPPFKGKKMPLELRKRLSISHKGKPSNRKGKLSFYKGNCHWNWKGGITNKNRYQRTLFTKYYQKKVLERDDYTCQLCGIRGVALQVDHIQSWAEYIELRFNIENCRTLCQKCHYQITFGKPMPPTVRAWGHYFLKGENLK